MTLEKVFEALEDALRSKELLIDFYKKENDQLRAEVKSLKELLNDKEGGATNAQ